MRPVRRFFKSAEDYTRELVQVELLEIGGVVYRREWRRATVKGKLTKFKSGWVELTDKVDDLCTGVRNGLPYRLRYKQHELYSAPLNPNLGPKL